MRPAHEALRRPGRDDKGDQQGKDHGRRCADRYRAHVWPHQSAHHRHRQDCRDYGERRQDGRVADFVDRFHGDIAKGPVPVLRHAPVPDDILNDDDGIVDQDPDGKNEGKQSDAVQRIAVQEKDDKRQRQSHGDRNRDHSGFPESQDQPDQDRDG